MNGSPSHWPADFAAFTHNRNRALDRLAADSVLREIGRRAVEPSPERAGPSSTPTVSATSELAAGDEEIE